MPGFKVEPSALDMAPLNTRVRITFPREAKSDKVLIREKLAKGAPRAPVVVKSERRDFQSADFRMAELVPDAPLAPLTRYEVLVLHSGGKETAIGEFSTGGEPDTTPPSWEGLVKATFFQLPATCCNCSTGSPYATLVTSKATDPESKSSALSYEIWASDENGQVDFSKPPLMILRDWSGHISLGHQSQCTPANFRFPEKRTSLKIGVRVVDLAGNQGKPSEIEIDLAHPVTAAGGRN
ncbi:MAG: hypothetical protein HY698_01680 [Deltaproteobacteria bacterium]|nr:hypothetical protein [Deltaproteobacteria bacterium]